MDDELGSSVLNVTDCFLSGQELENLSPLELREHLQNVTVFYRTTPSHKMKIVKELQSMGHVVAMTGDGGNICDDCFSLIFMSSE